MVTVLPPAGPFGQLANASFLLAAIFGDLLLLRAFLTAAYIFLLLGATTGYPRWAGFDPGEALSVDGIAWASVCLVLHGFALARLLLDERRIKFKSDDEEQLWRFFYRRSGMGRLEMKQVLKFGRWVCVPAGQRILGARESQQRLCLLVEGRAAFHTCYHGCRDVHKPLLSGQVFDLGLLNVFGVFIGFEKNEHRQFHAVAETDCLLYSWDVEELSAMATQCAPVVGAFWRNFVLCQLGLEFDLRSHKGAQPLCATGELESLDVYQGGRSRDFTDPLRSYEQQRTTLKGLARWVWGSLTPVLPPGMRHRSLPVSGILARNRVIAVKTAQAWAALSVEPSVEEGAAYKEGEEEELEVRKVAVAAEAAAWPPATELVPGVTVRGGVAAHRLLQQLESMRLIEAADVPQLVRELSRHGGSEGLKAMRAAAARPRVPRSSLDDLEEGRGGDGAGCWGGRENRGPNSPRSPPGSPRSPRSPRYGKGGGDGKAVRVVVVPHLG